MVLLAVGDICGEPGLSFFERHIGALRKTYNVELCIANGENADFTGILPAQAARLYGAGADFVTLGNHTFRKAQIFRALDDEPYLLRPLNYSGRLPGKGLGVHITGSGRKAGILSLVGRYSCEWNSDSPFSCLDRVLAAGECDLYIVDFHAEATSEKTAMGYFADGRVAALFGTHTHVQTSDERIFPGGMGYITDIGMTGAAHSVLGIKPEQSLALFLGLPPVRYSTPDGPRKLEGALFDIDEASGKCVKTERIRIEE